MNELQAFMIMIMELLTFILQRRKSHSNKKDDFLLIKQCRVLDEGPNDLSNTLIYCLLSSACNEKRHPIFLWLMCFPTITVAFLGQKKQNRNNFSLSK